MDAETFVHLLEVLVDGRGSDSELRGDLRVRPASCDVLENRALSRREPVESQIFLAEEEDDQFCRGCCAQRESMVASFDDERLLPTPQRAEHRLRNAPVRALEIRREESPGVRRGELDHTVARTEDDVAWIVGVILFERRKRVRGLGGCVAARGGVCPARRTPRGCG